MYGYSYAVRNGYLYLPIFCEDDIYWIDTSETNAIALDRVGPYRARSTAQEFRRTLLKFHFCGDAVARDQAQRHRELQREAQGLIHDHRTA